LTSSTLTPLKSSDTQSPPRELPLIHPVSAILLVAVDSLWTLADWAAVAWMITIPLSFLAVALPTFFVQKFLKKDPIGKSMAVASLLGVLAAIPTPITGTIVGAIALGLAGLRSLR
jgi:hypothetical protein